MRYGDIKYLNKKASRIIFGCAVGPMLSGKDFDSVLSVVLENGINTFDTGRVYGQSEEVLGRWLAKQNREDVIVETKCCHPDGDVKRIGSKFAFEDVNRSLDALKTDYIDVYLLHRDNEDVPVGEIIGFMNELIDKKCVKAIGVSNWRAERVAKANAYATAHGLQPFSVSSPQYGLAKQIGDPWGGCIGISGEAMQAERDWYKKEGVSIFAFSSLAGGLLSGKCSSKDDIPALLPPYAVKAFYCAENVERLARAERLAKEKNATVAQIALAWLLSDAMQTYAVMSPDTAERVRDNAAAFEIALSDEERAWLNLERELLS